MNCQGPPLSRYDGVVVVKARTSLTLWWCWGCQAAPHSHYDGVVVVKAHLTHVMMVLWLSRPTSLTLWWCWGCQAAPHSRYDWGSPFSKGSAKITMISLKSFSGFPVNIQTSHHFPDIQPLCRWNRGICVKTRLVSGKPFSPRSVHSSITLADVEAVHPSLFSVFHLPPEEQGGTQPPDGGEDEPPPFRQRLRTISGGCSPVKLKYGDKVFVFYNSHVNLTVLNEETPMLIFMHNSQAQITELRQKLWLLFTVYHYTLIIYYYTFQWEILTFNLW